MSKADTGEYGKIPPTYWNAIIFRLDNIVRLLEAQTLQTDRPHYLGFCMGSICPGCVICRATVAGRSTTVTGCTHTCPNCDRTFSRITDA